MKTLSHGLRDSKMNERELTKVRANVKEESGEHKNYPKQNRTNFERIEFLLLFRFAYAVKSKCNKNQFAYRLQKNFEERKKKTE